MILGFGIRSTNHNMNLVSKHNTAIVVGTELSAARRESGRVSALDVTEVRCASRSSPPLSLLSLPIPLHEPLPNILASLSCRLLLHTMLLERVGCSVPSRRTRLMMIWLRRSSRRVLQCRNVSVASGHQVHLSFLGPEEGLVQASRRHLDGEATLGMLQAGRRAATEMCVIVKAHDEPAITRAIWRRASQLRRMKDLLNIIDPVGSLASQH